MEKRNLILQKGKKESQKGKLVKSSLLIFLYGLIFTDFSQGLVDVS